MGFTWIFSFDVKSDLFEISSTIVRVILSKYQRGFLMMQRYYRIILKLFITTIVVIGITGCALYVR